MKIHATLNEWRDRMQKYKNFFVVIYKIVQ